MELKERRSGWTGGISTASNKEELAVLILNMLLMNFDLQAFGVGALEDDDEDVYHRDSMSRYDTVLGGEEPGDGLYGWTAPQQYTKKRGRTAWIDLESPGKSAESMDRLCIYTYWIRLIDNVQILRIYRI